MVRIITVLFILLTAHTLSAQSIRVGYGGSPPFLLEDRKSGVAVDIWHTLSDQSGISYEYVKSGSVPDMLKSLNKGEIDLLIGPVSITSRRYTEYSFTRPFFVTSPGIVTSPESVNLWRLAKPFLSNTFLIAICFLLLVLFLAGNAFYFAERKSNEYFQVPYPRAVGRAVWFAIVTFTTVGYGDVVPKTVRGRVVAGVWMIVAMLTASSLTAGIASAFTLLQLRHSSIESMEDLRGKKTAAIAHSSGELYAKRYGADIVKAESIQDALRMIRSNKAAAFVYDYPALKYSLKNSGEVRLIQTTDLADQYCFVMRKGDRRLQSIDMGILRLRESGKLSQIYEEWDLSPSN